MAILYVTEEWNARTYVRDLSCAPLPVCLLHVGDACDVLESDLVLYPGAESVHLLYAFGGMAQPSVQLLGGSLI